MKIAASIVSWVGGIITIIMTWNQCAPLIAGGYAWIPILLTVVMIGILIGREIAVPKGHKIALGVLTLLFVSLIGGILTLCIPDDSLNGAVAGSRSPSKPLLSDDERNRQIAIADSMLRNRIITQAEHSKRIAAINAQCRLKGDDTVEKIREYRKRRDEGEITQEEFEMMRDELLSKKNK